MFIRWISRKLQWRDGQLTKISLVTIDTDNGRCLWGTIFILCNSLSNTVRACDYHITTKDEASYVDGNNI